MGADRDKKKTAPPPTRTRVLVVYTAEPGRGSEPGVGWGFVLVSAKKCRDLGQTLTIVLRSDDREKCEPVIFAEGLTPWVQFLDVAPPKGRIASIANNRVGYLIWRRHARRAILELATHSEILSIHQANWGTAVLPHAIPSSLFSRAIWGPLAIPRLPGKSPDKKITNAMLAWISTINARGVRRVIANNDYSHKIFINKQRRDQQIHIEPHLFADNIRRSASVDGHLITALGLLIRRKRVDLTLRALATEHLRDFRLQIIGDGPERDNLENLAGQLGVADRVHFLGWLPKTEALEKLASSAVLLHPSEREGAGFAVAEAAACGVPAVTCDDTGAATVVRLSNNGGTSVPRAKQVVQNLALAVATVAKGSRHNPVTRWRADRFDTLLPTWWNLETE